MSFKEMVLSVFFPKRCTYCGKIIKIEENVCDDCSNNILRISDDYCTFCGADKNKCNCKKKNNAYSAVAAPFYYDGAVKKAIKRMKFSDRPAVAKTLSAEMSDCIANKYGNIDFDIITCVPMSKKELRNRGYNQSELLANGLKVKGNPTIDTQLLEKIYNVQPQHSLDAIKRQGNVLGVFDVAEGKNVSGKTILLCDDIKTTGATANECASVLVSAGADRVYLVCAAIAISRD